MATSNEHDDLVESDDYYAWLGVSKQVGCLNDDSCSLQCAEQILNYNCGWLLHYRYDMPAS